MANKYVTLDNLGTFKDNLDQLYRSIQYSTLPAAAINYSGKIVQYTGATDSNYANGYFYQCVEENGNYSWVQKDIQPESQSDLAYCTYGTTTFSEVTDMISAGRLPVCRYTSSDSHVNLYIYQNFSLLNGYEFYSIDNRTTEGITNRFIRVGTNSEWSYLTSTNVTVDDSLSTTSENPVQNKVITNDLNTRALDTSVVHKTGNEDIYGLKAFDTRPKIGIEGILPTGYDRIEYVQSVNGQYINTGYTSHNIGKAKMQISFDDVINDQWLLGYQMTVGGALSHNGYDIFIALESGEIKYKITTVEAYVAGNPIRTISSGLTPTVGTVYNIETEIVENNQYIKIDGVILGTSTYKLDTQQQDAYLFRVNGSNGNNKLGQIKLYSCKLYNVNGDLIRDYMPCKRISDNEVGLYDFVSETFYASATTSFVGGSAVTPTDDNYMMIKGDIVANPVLDGTESALTGLEIKGTKHKVLQPNWGNIGGTLSNQTDLQNALNAKSTVSVSSIGTATDEVSYITINGVEKKIAGNGGSGGSGITYHYFTEV